MGRIFLFILALALVTVASVFIWFPLFIVIGGTEALAILLWGTIGVYNAMVYDTMKYRNYIIPKNFHTIIARIPMPVIYFNKTKNVSKQFVFSDSCRYNSDDISCVNKLYGISFGLHHKNSVRFGWNYNELSGRMVLYAYIYKNGVRYIYKLSDEINIGQLYTYDILISNYNKITFVITRNIDNKTMGIQDIAFDNLPRWGYKLYPYFGGDSKAPHKIKIKEIYF
jgi:c-di-AMP phosphodiesterase-like protein